MIRLPYLIYALLFTILSSCSYLKNVQLLSGGKLKKQNFVEVLPFTLVKDIIVIKAQVNGDTTAHDFIFDTGAFNSKIEKQLADKIGLKKITTKENSTASGISREIEVTRIDSITLGNTSFYAIGAGKVVYDASSASPCIAESGIIGANLIKLAYWKIDNQKQLIYFSDKAFELPDNTLDIPFEHPVLSGTPTIDLKVGKHEVKNILFDVGYNGGLVLPSSLKDNFEGQENIILDNATTGIYGAKIDTLYEKKLLVSINSFQTEIPVSFSANNKALLGNAFLKHFDLYIDYNKDLISLVPKRKVKVEPTSIFLPAVLNDSLWVVSRTALNSPLQLGDTLISINNKKPKDLFNDFCDYFMGISELYEQKDFVISTSTGEKIIFKNEE